jgi:hypothetical protein
MSILNPAAGIILPGPWHAVSEPNGILLSPKIEWRTEGHFVRMRGKSPVGGPIAAQAILFRIPIEISTSSQTEPFVVLTETVHKLLLEPEPGFTRFINRDEIAVGTLTFDFMTFPIV